jgi:transposase
MNIIAFDSHKHYTLARVETQQGQKIAEQRINHEHGNIYNFLANFEKGTKVAIETIGNWYWIVNEIEQADMQPMLVHAKKAKLMIGSINKTDKLDVRGLNLLQRTGTLPTVWIPPGEIRDKRELARTRMVFANQRTRLKNRIHSVIDKYGYQNRFADMSDIFGSKGRAILNDCLKLLPAQTAYTAKLLLVHLDTVCSRIDSIEARMKKVFESNEDIELLMSLPGIGFILAVVISLEAGDINRFASAQKFAGYCGIVPRVHSSGDKVRYGSLRTDCNHYLKWAYSEAGNSVAVNRFTHSQRHVSKLYNRIRSRKGHCTAVGAVGRHLSEATYWVLSKREKYVEPSFVKAGISATLS